jgi:putative ABC transport system permease protein
MVLVVAPCDGAFQQEARKLPGVAATACASYPALNLPGGQALSTVRGGNGRTTTFSMAPVRFGFFELFGVRPLAGRLFQRDHGEDAVLTDPKATAPPTVIINLTAARALGFADPAAAIGKPLYWAQGRPGPSPAAGPPPLVPSRIIGVAPDMPASVRVAADPSFYFVGPASFFVCLRLTGQDMPATIRAIGATWKRTNAGEPLNQLILSQFRQSQYLDLVIQSGTIAICAGLAVLIACLGLFALTAYTTERRTKEIGVRKAMGARTSDVVFLLLWQFTLPVLAATAIAVPLGFLAMQWWLHGFVYHPPLSAWIFVLAAAAAVAIAWCTVSWQSFVVARGQPAGARRYE